MQVVYVYLCFYLAYLPLNVRVAFYSKIGTIWSRQWIFPNAPHESNANWYKQSKTEAVFSWMCSSLYKLPEYCWVTIHITIIRDDYWITIHLKPWHDQSISGASGIDVIYLVLGYG